MEIFRTKGETMMMFRVLGHFGFTTHDGAFTSPPRLPGRIGTMLAGWPGQVVDRDRLLAEVWGDHPPKTAVNTLQAHVSQLRRLIGPNIVVGTSGGYLLDVAPPQVDADLFLELIGEAARARRHLHLGRVAELLSQAIDLWNGVAYMDVSDPELRARADRLNELRDSALEDRLECRLELARDDHEVDLVVADARELISLKPIRERRHALLIRALAAANQLAEANAAYTTAVQHIRAVTGNEPGPLLASVVASVNDPSNGVHPMIRRRSVAGPLGVSRYVERPVHLANRVKDALVDHHAPVILVRAEAEDHSYLAECMREQLVDDFPQGVRILSGSDVATGMPDVPKGVLAIIIGASCDAIAERIAFFPLDQGSILAISSDEPTRDIGVPIITAADTAVAEPVLNTAS
jgi:DNA-binding SARP family transcriptional activator